MHRLLMVLFLIAFPAQYIYGTDLDEYGSAVYSDAYLPTTYEKACEALKPPFGGHAGYEEEAAVFRTMREKRSTSMLSCHCGLGTLGCEIHSGIKYCKCLNDTWVVDHSCEDCSCPNGVCDGTSKCRCLRGYGLRSENTCEACNCDDFMPCKFADDIKLCVCYDSFISVNRGCKGCDCGKFELCFDRQEVKRCACPGKSGSLPECNNTVIQGDCDCTVNIFCTYNATEMRCKCMPGYVKLNGTCTECRCDDENAICDFQNGEKVCICKNRFVEHNGTCVECFCGEGHSCEMKNGSTACTCLKGHIEHDGICKECICGEGKDCELVDGKKLCLCKENYIEVDGVCKECFCGEGHECNYFAGAGKLCMCRKYFSESNGTCKDCHCGGGHDCEFRDGIKSCLCSPGFSGKNGTCVECFCGSNGYCVFDGDDKVCICNHGFIFKNGTCHEICRNDTCDRGICEIGDDHFKCSCDIGFGGDRCDQKLALSKEASYVIYTLTVVTLFWIILVAAYFIRKRRKRNPSYHKVSGGGSPDESVFMTTVQTS